MQTLLQDIRYAVRNLRRSPGFAVAAIATLTLAIGASTAAFSVVDGVLLKPLPFDEPDSLVRVYRAIPERRTTRAAFTKAAFVDFRDQTTRFDGLASYRAGRATRLDDGPPEMVEYAEVSAGLFDLLRVRPVIGSFFDSERLSDGTMPAVISHGHWQERWGGRAGAMGQTFQLQDKPVMTIVRFSLLSFVNAGEDPVWSGATRRGSPARCRNHWDDWQTAKRWRQHQLAGQAGDDLDLCH